VARYSIVLTYRCPNLPARLLVHGFLYKVTIIKFPNHLVKTVFLSPFREIKKKTSDEPYRLIASYGMAWLRMDYFGVSFSLYVTDMPKLFRQVDLALYAVDTAFIVTFHQPTLLVNYLQTYLSKFDRCLRDWRIAIRVSKSTAVFFVKNETLPKAPTSSVLWGANPVG
jgi:hypothetical protein